MDRINRSISLEDFGLNDISIKDINKLPLIIELANRIYRENLQYGVWDSYGYKHHIHGKTMEECINILKPIANKMLNESNDISFDELLQTLSIGGPMNINGIDKKKYQDIIENYNIIGTCYKWIHITENIMRKFILKFLKDKNLPSDRTIFNKKLQNQVQSRLDKEDEKTYLPKRGGHDIYYLDFKDLNIFFNKYQGVFNTIFVSIAWITDKVNELYDIRNLIAHNSSNIDNNTLNLVKVYCRQIIKQIDPHI